MSLFELPKHRINMAKSVVNNNYCVQCFGNIVKWLSKVRPATSLSDGYISM